MRHQHDCLLWSFAHESSDETRSVLQALYVGGIEAFLGRPIRRVDLRSVPLVGSG